jgi:hypothetical protein
LFALGYLKTGVVSEIAGRFLDFLSWTGPYLAVSRFFDATELEVRNLLLLGAWFCSWLWFYRHSRAPSIASDLYVASGIWAGWWLFIWSANTYLPGRYLVHFVVPATIHVMAGLSLGSSDTIARIVTSLGRRHHLARAAILSWLVLPSAFFIASVAAAAVGATGWSIERLSERIITVVVLIALLASFVSYRTVNQRSIVGCLAFPVVMALVWLVGRELALFSGFWSFDSTASAALWMACGGAAFVFCFAQAPQVLINERPTVTGAVAIVLLAAIYLAQAAPSLLFPTYSIRDASRDLAQHLPAGGPIQTVTASSLFLENRVKYHELRSEDRLIDGLVILEHGVVARRFLASERATQLVRVQAYPLTISPKYRAPDGTLEMAIIGIYRAK